MRTWLNKLLLAWNTLNGEAAYQRYLAHWYRHHAEPLSQPLSRKQRKWNGIKRCC